EKISEPFEHFEFLNKPFDQKQLISSIKAAMAKAKQPRNQPVAVAAASTNGTNAINRTNGTNGTIPAQFPNSQAEIDALNQKMAKMQSEIDGLKKQLTQVVAFIKQKMK
ncbi:MAG: response regulator, partial [Cyanobacteria bacterium P01_D01_bin.116]